MLEPYYFILLVFGWLAFALVAAGIGWLIFS